jgi:hypothetical protein
VHEVNDTHYKRTFLQRNAKLGNVTHRHRGVARRRAASRGAIAGGSGVGRYAASRPGRSPDTASSDRPFVRPPRPPMRAPTRAVMLMATSLVMAVCILVVVLTLPASRAS